MPTFSSRAVEPPRAMVFFFFSTWAISPDAPAASSSEESSFVRFLTLPRPNFPFFLNPPNPPALNEDAEGKGTSAHDTMGREDIGRQAAGMRRTEERSPPSRSLPGISRRLPWGKDGTLRGYFWRTVKNENVFERPRHCTTTHTDVRVKTKMASNSGARLLTLLGRARHTVTGSLSQGTHSQLTASGRRLEWDVSRCVAHRFTTGANAWMANGGEASGPGQLIEHMKAKVRMRLRPMLNLSPLAGGSVARQNPLT